MEIIDAHSHIDSLELCRKASAAGICRVIASPLTGVLAKSAEDLQRGNHDALKLYHANPDFYYPAVTVHPGFPKESIRCLNEFADNGLIWAGEWAAYNCDIPFDRPEWEPFFRFCSEKNMIVQLHNHESVPVIAARYPEMTVIAAHLIPGVLPLLAKHNNVFVDISGIHGGLVRGALQEAAQIFGTERLLFGTDYPGYYAEAFIDACRRLFPAAQRRQIFSCNLKTIMKRHGIQL